MSDPDTLMKLFQGVTAVAPIAQGFTDRGTARRNAETLRTQGRAALDGAAADETAYRREARAEIAKQAAGVIAEGQGTSSAMDVLRQTEVDAIQSALNIRFKGQVEYAGFESKALAMEAEGDDALAAGLMQSGGAGGDLLLDSYQRREREHSRQKRFGGKY